MKRGILVSTDQFREAVSSLTLEGQRRLLVSGLPFAGCSLATLLLAEAHFRITDLDRFGAWHGDKWLISWGAVPQTFGLSGRSSNMEGFREYFKPGDWVLLHLAPSYHDWRIRLRNALAALPDPHPRRKELQALLELSQPDMIAASLRHFDITAMMTGITRLGLVTLAQDRILNSLSPDLNVNS